MIVAFIDEHKHRWGIEPICRVLSENTEVKIAPGTYYAFVNREPSARARRDAVLKEHIMRIHAHPRMRVYGIRKIHAQLVREGHDVARCTVERLCRELGVRGTVRGRWPRTTKPAPEKPLSGIPAKRIDHLNLMSSDVTAAKDSFERHLGFRTTERVVDGNVEIGA